LVAMSTLEKRASDLADAIETLTTGQEDPRENFGLSMDLDALRQIAAGNDSFVDASGFVHEAEKRVGQVHARQTLEAAGLSYAAELPTRYEVRNILRTNAGISDESPIEVAVPGDLQAANEMRELRTMLREMQQA